MATTWLTSAVLCLAFFCLLGCSAENNVLVDREPRRLTSMGMLNKLAEASQDLELLRELISEKDEQLHQTRDEKQLRDVHILRQLLSGLDTGRPQKRTCKVNLGGHCSTENAVAMAERWNFLSGANSPGRRRRRHAEHLLKQGTSTD